MNNQFSLHPRLAEDTHWLADCRGHRILLMNDSQYPWLIVVPLLADINELHQLTDQQQQLMWRFASQLGEQLMHKFNGDKLNFATLGNMVPQLHLHIILRYKTDPAWPAPVWGAVAAMPYEDQQAAKRIEELRSLIASIII